MTYLNVDALQEPEKMRGSPFACSATSALRQKIAPELLLST